MSDQENFINKLARDLVQIERKSFYGAEPERDRLKKMRELIDEVHKENEIDT